MKTLLFLSLIFTAPTAFAISNCQIKEKQDVSGEPWGRGRSISRSSIDAASMSECADAGKALLGRISYGEYRFTGRAYGKNNSRRRHRTDLHAKFVTDKVVMNYFDANSSQSVTIKFREN